MGRPTHMSVDIFPITAADEAAFLDAVRRSRALFAGWVDPPDSPERFASHLHRFSTETDRSFLAKTSADGLIGCINLGSIVRGAFQSAYMGYYAFEPNQARGLMKQAMAITITHAFTELQLHRLEANIQPQNHRSIGLVRSLGFRLEGHSPCYLKIAGEWRDHKRYAITSEEWSVGTGAA